MSSLGFTAGMHPAVLKRHSRLKIKQLASVLADNLAGWGETSGTGGNQRILRVRSVNSSNAPIVSPTL